VWHQVIDLTVYHEEERVEIHGDYGEEQALYRQSM
jgi:hypothetical protein